MKISTKKMLIPVVIAIAVLAGLATQVSLPPTPKHIIILQVPDGPCLGTAASAVQGLEGVVGVGLDGRSGELHVGVREAVRLQEISAKLESEKLQATYQKTLSPLEYKRKMGHYFKNGVTGTWGGSGCGG